MPEQARAVRSFDRPPQSLDALSVPAASRGARPAGWDLLLGCVAVYIATTVGRVHQLFPVLLPLKPAFVAALLAVGLYLLQQSGQRRVQRLPSRTTLYLLGLLLCAVLSIPAALNQGVAFYSMRDFAKTVLMYFVIAGSVRSLRDVERLTLVYFGVTVVYTAVVLSRFQLGADSWRLDRLYYYDGNDLATLIASAMPLGLYFVLSHRRTLVRVLAFVGLVVLAVGQIRSGSRGGFLASLAVVAFVLLRFTAVPARARLAGLLVILIVIFAASSEKYWTQMQTIVHSSEDYNTTSDAGRMKTWERGLGYMASHPVLGVGAGNFAVAEGTISPLARLQERGIRVRWGAAHNSFLQVGAELGIPGLLLFIGLIATAFTSLRRVARRPLAASPPAGDVSRLAQSLMAALVGWVVGAFFLSLAYTDMLYTLVALVVGLAKIAGGNETRSGQRPRPSWI